MSLKTKMKKRTIILFLIILSVYSCKPKENIVKNVTCGGNLKVEYEWLDLDKEDRNHIVANKYFKGGFTIYFVSEYDDLFKLYVNNEFIIKKEISRTEDDKIFNSGFSFGKAEDSIPIFKVESINKKSCFDVKLNRKYPILYVWLAENGKWTIRFSNFIHSDNLKACVNEEKTY
ncbi:hypothetical protein B0A77_03210 [Flavobacterium branchiophilum]|uniref:Lipoprotein n=2 Tax=Flavobacterium branchiophilum TaxID=55197 RepID=A0A2H3KQ17_9FLAO|nr:hypothetical protein B0A77_03210 [Flavobacterium branchiophilum]